MQRAASSAKRRTLTHCPHVAPPPNWMAFTATCGRPFAVLEHPKAPLVEKKPCSEARVSSALPLLSQSKHSWQLLQTGRQAGDSHCQ